MNIFTVLILIAIVAGAYNAWNRRESSSDDNPDVPTAQKAAETTVPIPSGMADLYTVRAALGSDIPRSDIYGTYGSLRRIGPDDAVALYAHTSAENLLQLANDRIQSYDLAQSKYFANSQCIITTPNTSILWSLIDSPNGSAIVFIKTGEQPDTPIVAEIFGMPDSDTSELRTTTINNGICAKDAADILGTGDVVAPWFVAGYEHTITPYNEQSLAEDKAPYAYLPPTLYHTLREHWSRFSFCGFKQRFPTPLFPTPYAVYVGGGDMLVLADGTTAKEPLMYTSSIEPNMAAFNGIDQVGPYFPAMLAGDTQHVLLCTRVDPNASIEQLDTQGLQLAEAVIEWYGRRHARR